MPKPLPHRPKRRTWARLRKPSKARACERIANWAVKRLAWALLNREVMK
jgi:hypothetical protein